MWDIEEYAARLVATYNEIDAALQEDDMDSIDYLEERVLDIRSDAHDDGYTDEEIGAVVLREYEEGRR